MISAGPRPPKWHAHDLVSVHIWLIAGTIIVQAQVGSAASPRARVASSGPGRWHWHHMARSSHHAPSSQAAQSALRDLPVGPWRPEARAHAPPANPGSPGRRPRHHDDTIMALVLVASSARRGRQWPPQRPALWASGFRLSRSRKSAIMTRTPSLSRRMALGARRGAARARVHRARASASATAGRPGH